MMNPGDIPLVRTVLVRIEERMPDPRSLKGLSEVEADLMSAVTAKGIIDNGGLVHWFEGMDRAKTLRAAAAFDRMGEPSAAEAMRQGLRAFPGGVPSPQHVREHRDQLRETFWPCDQTVWDLDFYAAAATYIRARTPDLLSTDPELVKVAPALRPQ